MKKLLPLLLIAILLTGCVLPSSSTAEPQIIQPTLSDVEMQTQIAMVLTAMPTPTVMAQIPPTNTPELALATATGSPEQPTATTEAAVVPTNTPEPQQPTATTAPTQAPPTATSGPAFTAAPGDPRGRLGSPSSSDPMNDWDQLGLADRPE